MGIISATITELDDESKKEIDSFNNNLSTKLPELLM